MSSVPGRISRIVPYAVVGAGAGYLYHVASRIEYHHRAGTLGPDFWPKLILVLLIAVCAYEIVKVLAFGARAGATGVLDEIVEESVKEQGDAGPAVVSERRPLMLAGGIALTAAYVWIIPQLGFFLATAPYVAAFIALGGYRRWGVNAAVSVIGTLAMMFFFMKLVYVSLPLGQEPFAQVTFFLMRVMGIR
jgi:putative tricarboxylic transport membrane protein